MVQMLIKTAKQKRGKTGIVPQYAKHLTVEATDMLLTRVLQMRLILLPIHQIPKP